MPLRHAGCIVGWGRPGYFPGAEVFMARVEVQAGRVEGGRIAALRVKLHALPARSIDRDTAIAWMRDGHSFIPVAGGADGAALRLVEVGEETVEVFIRHDHDKSPADSLPELPRVG